MRVASTLTDDESRCDMLTPEQLCLGYAHRVYQFALMVSRDTTEAEDLAQDALIRAISRLDQFDPASGTLETWLWRIVTNVARDAGRVKRRQRALLQRLFLTQPPAKLTEPDVSL